MWFWVWFANGGEINVHKVLLASALASALAGAAILSFAGWQGDWREVEARVLSVREVCRLSTSSDAWRSRSHSVVLDCDQVDRFRADNPGSWTVDRSLMGALQVGESAGRVTVDTALSRFFDAVPQKGDRTIVLQNPQSPTEIAARGGPLTLSILGYTLLGFGGFLAAVAFSLF